MPPDDPETGPVQAGPVASLSAGRLLRSSGRAQGGVNDRIVRYIFSDGSVGRDNHIIAPDAWVLDNFLRNPVFLWAHDADAPPIGRVTDIGTVQGRLQGSVEYAERDVYPFADTIYQLTKAGFLNATSTGWRPIDWTPSKDRARPGGVDFRRVELMEISAVPVPALPSALVTARAAGIDTRPLFDWAERMLDCGGFVAIPRAELEILRREARMPASPNPGAVAGAPEPAAEITPAEAGAPAALERAAPSPGPPAIKMTKRGLHQVSWLAMMLADLGVLQNRVAEEAAIEADGSAVPAQLLDALKALAAVLIAMTGEEVSEMLNGTDEPASPVPDVGETMEMASSVDLKRSALHALLRLDDGALGAVGFAMRRHLAGARVAFTAGNAPQVPLQRAGRVLSADNERCLRDAVDMHDRACGMIRSVIDQNASPAETADAAEARALRERKARARKLAAERSSFAAP